MSLENKIYAAKFGQLSLKQGPEGNFIWAGSISVTSNIFSGEIPVFIITKDQQIPPCLIEFVETIVSNAPEYLEISMLYIKQRLTEEKEKYKVKAHECCLLSRTIYRFPLDHPEFTFWEDSKQWMVRFAEGEFEICNPFGISVTYDTTIPKEVENLEDSEEIDG